MRSVPVSSSRLKGIGVLSVAAVALVVFALWNPSEAGFFPPCPVLKFTGLYCPGCGTQRALHQLLHGHLGAAVRFNPLAVLTTPVMLYGFGSYLWQHLGWKRWPRVFVPAVWLWAFFWVVIAFTVLRNVPLHPFSLLAPQ